MGLIARDQAFPATEAPWFRRSESVASHARKHWPDQTGLHRYGMTSPFFSQRHDSSAPSRDPQESRQPFLQNPDSKTTDTRTCSNPAHLHCATKPDDA